MLHGGMSIPISPAPQILSAARNAALVLFCAVVLGESVTPMQALFYSLSLVAFVVYSMYAK